MAQRTAEWHEGYTLPSLWSFYQPSRAAHGSYWFDWTTADEVAWKDNYRRWMTFVNEYKNRGGRVCTGSDAGFIYKLYGFGFIRELELFQEAGFHPLEVVRRRRCARDLLAKPPGKPAETGVVRPACSPTSCSSGDPCRLPRHLSARAHNSTSRATGRVGACGNTIKDASSSTRSGCRRCARMGQRRRRAARLARGGPPVRGACAASCSCRASRSPGARRASGRAADRAWIRSRRRRRGSRRRARPLRAGTGSGLVRGLKSLTPPRARAGAPPDSSSPGPPHRATPSRRGSSAPRLRPPPRSSTTPSPRSRRSPPSRRGARRHGRYPVAARGADPSL